MISENASNNILSFCYVSAICYPINVKFDTAACRHWQDASKVISPFIIFDIFGTSFRQYKLQINYSFFTFVFTTGLCYKHSLMSL